MQPAELVERISRELANATEVAPNHVHVLTLHEMLEHLGMESAMKEKRFLDRRPKS